MLQGLHDLHTGLTFTDPARRGWVAALPVYIERCGTVEQPRYLVTKTAEGLPGPKQKAEVTHWNGVPIDVAVTRLAARTKGANPGAALARAIEQLTVRPLDEYLPPDEEWVSLSVRGRVQPYRLEWQYLDAGTELPADGTESGLNLGLDRNGLTSQAAKQLMFSRNPNPTGTFMVGTERTVAGRTIGYLRLYSFLPEDSDAGLDDVRRRLESFATGCDGIVVDIRNNPGGSVPLAEDVIALLTGHRPRAGFTLRASPAPKVLAPPRADLARWKPSVGLALRTGARFSAPLAVTAGDGPDPVTDLPAVLITDGTTYSAGDIFAAGWADSGLGPIIGTAAATGAGGANVWTLSQLRSQLPETEAARLELPAGLDLRFSLRRALRAGPSQSVPLEDFGVAAGEVHELTPRDLLGGNEALISAAVAVLPARRVP